MYLNIHLFLLVFVPCCFFENSTLKYFLFGLENKNPAVFGLENKNPAVFERKTNKVTPNVTFLYILVYLHFKVRICFGRFNFFFNKTCPLRNSIM